MTTRFLLTTAALAAFSLSTLCAQSFETVRVTFDKPVEVGGTNVPAGDYTISMIRSNGDIPVLRFHGEHGVNVVTFASRQLRVGSLAATKSEVVLDNKGSNEQVTRIEIEGSASDYVLPLAHSHQSK